MNIALIGYGQMGRKIHQIAMQKGHNIVSIIDPFALEANFKTLSPQSFNNANVAIDFSHPSSVLLNIETTLEAEIPLIVGTTGWYENLESIQKKVEEKNTAFLWASNFSIGVQYYFKIIQKASELFNNAEEYDIWATELHHKNKVDSPSGTAKTIGDILLKNIKRKTVIVDDSIHRKREDNEIHFSSTRGGVVNFSHTVGFDSEEDCITLIHSARNRDGYAKGAVFCAEWIVGKRGFFSIEDIL